MKKYNQAVEAMADFCDLLSSNDLWQIDKEIRNILRRQIRFVLYTDIKAEIRNKIFFEYRYDQIQAIP